jgi:beta-galactosidase/beta-glucuronidase
VVRLHQKVNSQRWYYHADRLGIIVLQDMIQKYGGAYKETVPLFYDDLQHMIYGRCMSFNSARVMNLLC